MNRELKPSFKKKISLNIFKHYTGVQSKLHDLKYLFWECTVRCNIKCLYCGSDCQIDDGSADMPAVDFLKVTEQIKEYYNPNKLMIVLTGGEPLMRNDLEFVGQSLYKQGYPWGMVTNAFALTEQKFQNLLKSGLRSITISLDGLEAEHNWLRGRETSFQKAINAILIVAKQQDIAFDVASCVNSRNIQHLQKLKDLLISLGVKCWRLFLISPIGRAKYDEELKISDVQFYELIEFIKQTREEGKIELSFGCEGYMGKYEGEIRQGYFFCRAGINIASILNDGSISTCPNNSREVIQGNIYTDDFMKVWQNKYQIMRDKTWAKTGKCADCDSFDFCKGNGMHLHDFENNDVLVCHLEKLVNGMKLWKKQQK